MSLQVLSPGLLSSVQALSRAGHRHLGVPLSGALDRVSLRLANLLVGNEPGTAALEITLHGPRLRFDRPALVAITGADIEAHIGGQAIPGWRPILLPAGVELAMGACRRGARAYLAMAGGVAVPERLGSQSTDLRSGFGGFHGRALQAGDSLAIADAERIEATDAVKIARWWIVPGPDLDFATPASIRLLPGSDALSQPTKLHEGEFRVAAASNRQGLRLQGDALEIADGRERISAPVSPGTLQLPPDGQPILLLADAQTVGGYPRIAHAIEADWPRLAQLRPGDRLRFALATPEDATRAACEQDQRVERIALAIRQRRQQGYWRSAPAP